MVTHSNHRASVFARVQKEAVYLRAGLRGHRRQSWGLGGPDSPGLRDGGSQNIIVDENMFQNGDFWP